VRRLPNKKVIILVVALFFVVVAVLWYVGHKNKQDVAEKQLAYYDKLISEQKNLDSVVTEATRGSDSLETLKGIIVPAYQPLKASTSSPESLKKYGEALAEAMLPLSEKHENENQIMLRALDNKDASEIKKLVNSRVTYEDVVISLKKIVTPAEADKQQREIVYTLSTISQIIANMEKVLQEPVLALQSGQLLNKQYSRLYINFENLNNFFRNKGISFAGSKKAPIYINN